MAHGWFRSRWLAGLTVAAALLPATAAAKTPSHQVVHPSGLTLTLELPSEWGGGPDRSGDWRYYAIAPGHVADVRVGASPTKAGFSAFAAGVVSAEQGALRRADARGSFAKRSTNVGPAPGLEITMLYRGYGEVSQMPGQRLAVVVYAFLHGGTAYVIQFTTTDAWLRKLRPVFRASARSVKFPNVA